MIYLFYQTGIIIGIGETAYFNCGDFSFAVLVTVVEQLWTKNSTIYRWRYEFAGRL